MVKRPGAKKKRWPRRAEGNTDAPLASFSLLREDAVLERLATNV